MDDSIEKCQACIKKVETEISRKKETIHGLKLTIDDLRSRLNMKNQSRARHQRGARQQSSERYSKVPKFSDARKLCCNLPKIQIKRPNLRVFSQKDANGIANSDLGLHYLLRPICPKT